MNPAKNTVSNNNGMQHVSSGETVAILWLNADTSKGDEAMSLCDCFWKMRLLSILICGMGDRTSCPAGDWFGFTPIVLEIFITGEVNTIRGHFYSAY